MKQVVAVRKDIVFFIKMFPLTQLHPEAFKKSQSIVCGADNAERLARLEMAFAKQALPEPDCESTEVEDTIRLAESLSIQGTPAVFIADGQKIGGAVPGDQIIQAIDALNGAEAPAQQ